MAFEGVWAASPDRSYHPLGYPAVASRPVIADNPSVLTRGRHASLMHFLNSGNIFGSVGLINTQTEPSFGGYQELDETSD